MTESIRQLTCEEIDPQRRGEWIGRELAAGIRHNLDAYEDLFRVVGVPDDLHRSYGETALAAVTDWAPNLADELVALAAGARVEPWRVGLLNARTEVLATVGATGEGECSTAISVDGSTTPRSMQTWDWLDGLHPALAVVRHPVPGGQVSYFTEAGMLAKIGLSSRGLGLHFNILSHDLDGDGIGVPVHVVARRVLDEAGDIATAHELAASAPVSASTSLSVFGANGAAVVELCPAGTALVPADDGYLVHTNHFVDPRLARGDRALPTSSTFGRYKVLSDNRSLVDVADPVRRANAFDVHDADGAPICCHPDPALPFQQRWRTLVTVTLDLGTGRLHYAPGGPGEASDEQWRVF